MKNNQQIMKATIKRFAIAAAIAAFLPLMAFVPPSGKWFTKNGHIGFFSHTSMEDIQAENESVVSVIDAIKGKIEFKVPVNAFLFRKKLMQEHFNENYMESDKYPDAKFSGVIDNNADVNYSVNGKYNVTSSGKLTMHGVTRDVVAKGSITVNGQTLIVESEFLVNPEDYKISIPGAVRNKIAEEIKITVNCKYQPYLN